MNAPNHIIIDGDAISIRQSEAHEYLVTTKEVARGYGVSESSIREHKRNHADELLTETHWTTVRNPDGGEPATLWTKLGVVTLGFFIRSERAKAFRKAAAQIILRHIEAQPAPIEDALRQIVTVLTGVTAALQGVQSVQTSILSRLEALEKQRHAPTPFTLNPAARIGADRPGRRPGEHEAVCGILARALGPVRRCIHVTSATLGDLCAQLDELPLWVEDGDPEKTTRKVAARLKAYTGRWIEGEGTMRYWIESQRTAHQRSYFIRREPIPTTGSTFGHGVGSFSRS